jgi:hypothetical protein
MDDSDACHLAKNSENSILAVTFICNTLTEIFTTCSHQHYLLIISTLPHTVKSHTQYGFIYFGTQGTEFQSVLSHRHVCSWERYFSSWRCVIYAYRDKFTWSENECVSSATVSPSTDYLNCTSLSCSEFTSNVTTNTCIISLSPCNCTLLLSVHPSIMETSVIRLSFVITL